MAQRTKNVKIHVETKKRVTTTVEGVVYTMTLCENLTPDDLVASEELLRDWATHNMTPTPFCSICVSRSDVKFKRQPYRDRTPVTA